MFLVTFMFFQLSFLAAQQKAVISWQKSYGGERNELAYAGVETPDGGYMIVGSTNSKNSFDVKDSKGYDGKGGNDFFVAKISATGTLEWTKAYGGTKDDVATGIVKTSNNEYYVLGTSISTDGDANFNGTNGGLLLLRIKADGTVITRRLFAGGSSGQGFTYVQAGTFTKPSIKILANGQLLVGASRINNLAPFSGPDFFLALLSPTADTVWEYAYGGGLEDYQYDVISCADGGYLMVGGTLSLERDIAGAGQGFIDALAIKVNDKGILTWKKAYGGTSFDMIYAAKENETKNGFLLVGESGSRDGVIGNSLGDKDGIIIKIDGAGAFKSIKHFGGSDIDGFFNIVAGANGDILLVGSSQSSIGDLNPKSAASDVWYLSLKESTLELNFQKLLGGADIDLARSLIYTSKGQVLLVASARSTDGDVSVNRGQSDFWAVYITPPPPIIFGRFEATLTPEQKIGLSWTTLQEENTQLIILEKSEDNVTFFQVEELYAAGNSSITKTYRSKDNNPKIGKTYYRLRYQNTANKYFVGPSTSYTFVSLGVNNTAPSQSVYPNPAIDYVYIPQKSISNLAVYDAFGRKIQAEVQIENELTKLNFRDSKTPGLYFIIADGIRYKFLIQQ